MKIKPEILLSSEKEISFKKILITGSDESFILHVKDFVINNFKKRNFNIDVSGNYNEGIIGSLFSEKKTLFLLTENSVKNIGINKSDDKFFLITSINNKKINFIKSTFAKTKDALVVDCYSLNRDSKERTLKHFIELNKLTLSSDVFWYIVEKFDNNYVIFIKQLQMLCLFSKNINLISDIEKISFVENKIEVNKIFFNIFKENKILTNAFNKSINSISDFYLFLNSTKQYIEIIKSSHDINSALSNFPKYLFAEKDIFLTIYKKTNKKKLKEIYKNISKVELLIRQNSEIYSIIGLRFFLNLKKIIIS